MANAVDELRGLALSADEVRRMTGWTDDQMVEDYLNIVRNFIELATIIDLNDTGVIELLTKLSQELTSLGGMVAKNRAMISKAKVEAKSMKGALYAW